MAAAFDFLDASTPTPRRAYGASMLKFIASGDTGNVPLQVMTDPGHLGRLATHATSGCWSGGKLPARREAS